MGSPYNVPILFFSLPLLILAHTLILCLNKGEMHPVTETLQSPPPADLNAAIRRDLNALPFIETYGLCKASGFHILIRERLLLVALCRSDVYPLLQLTVSPVQQELQGQIGHMIHINCD